MVRTPPPPLMKDGRSGEGTDFLQFGNKGGDEIFFLESERGWTKGTDCLERVTFFVLA